MALSPRTTRTETMKAAATLLGGLALLGLFAVLLGNVRFWENYTEHPIRFHSIQDLSAGREVKYGGLVIGKVLELGVDPGNPGDILVTIGVEPDFPLHRGVGARIAQKGLVGDNYILLELMADPGPRLAPAEEIPAQDVVTIQDLANMAGQLMTELGPKLTAIATSIEQLLDEENTKGLQQALAKLPGLVDQIQSAVGNLEAEFGSLGQTLRTETTRSADAVAQVSDRLAQSLDAIDTTVAAARDAVTSVGGELKATLKDVRPRLNATLDAAEQLTANLDADLEYDQTRLLMVMDELEAASVELRRLARSLRERPWQIIYKPEETP